MLNQRHTLYKLTGQIGWNAAEEKFRYVATHHVHLILARYHQSADIYTPGQI